MPRYRPGDRVRWDGTGVQNGKAQTVTIIGVDEAANTYSFNYESGGNSIVSPRLMNISGVAESALLPSPN